MRATNGHHLLLLLVVLIIMLLSIRLVLQAWRSHSRLRSFIGRGRWAEMCDDEKGDVIAEVAEPGQPLAEVGFVIACCCVPSRRRSMFVHRGSVAYSLFVVADGMPL